MTIKGSNADWREIEKYTPWPNADFHADTSFEINRELEFVLMFLSLGMVLLDLPVRLHGKINHIF